MDKFTKMRNIGKGNMGACALARNNEDGKYYVIKQVDLSKMKKKEREQSLKEAKDPARRIRLAEVLELPFIHRRLVDWLSGDILPKKYIDTLINQNFLPESVLSLTKGVEIPVAPPALSAPLDSGRSDMSTDSRKRKQLPPLQQLPPAKSETEEAAASAPAPATAPTLGFSAPLPPAESSSTTSTGNQPAEASPPDSSRPPSTTSSGHTKESHKENAVVDAGSSAPNSTRATPQRGNLQPLESPRPARSPAMYRYFKAPGLQPVSSRNQIQLNSDNAGPTHINGQDNFYHQVNYYQRDMYRNYGGQGRYLNPNLPALRRHGNVGRMENGQAVSHLNPLFHGHSNLGGISNSARDNSSRQQDIRSMLQRAGFMRKVWVVYNIVFHLFLFLLVVSFVHSERATNRTAPIFCVVVCFWFLCCFSLTTIVNSNNINKRERVNFERLVVATDSDVFAPSGTEGSYGRGSAYGIPSFHSRQRCSHRITNNPLLKRHSQCNIDKTRTSK
eukprot:gene9051-6351_t